MSTYYAKITKSSRKVQTATGGHRTGVECELSDPEHQITIKLKSGDVDITISGRREGDGDYDYSKLIAFKSFTKTQFINLILELSKGKQHG